MGGKATAGHIQSHLADADAHPVGAEVAKSEDSAAVCDHYDPDILQWAVCQDLPKAPPVVERWQIWGQGRDCLRLFLGTDRVVEAHNGKPSPSFQRISLPHSRGCRVSLGCQKTSSHGTCCPSCAYPAPALEQLNAGQTPHTDTGDIPSLLHWPPVCDSAAGLVPQTPLLTAKHHLSWLPPPHDLAAPDRYKPCGDV